LHCERYFTPCSHGPFVGGALFRFVPFTVSNSSSCTSALDSTSTTTSGTSILTRGRQTAVIPLAPIEVPRVDSRFDITSLKQNVQRDIGRRLLHCSPTLDLPRASNRIARRRCMDLQAFIVRGQVLSLMRQLIRATRNAPTDTRAELRCEIRRCFEQATGHTDRVTVKHLLSDGRIKLKMLKEMVGLTT